MNAFRFDISETNEGNYLVILYKNGLEYERNCLGNHRHAINWGLRAKSRAIKYESPNKSVQANICCTCEGCGVLLTASSRETCLDCNGSGKRHGG